MKTPEEAVSDLLVVLEHARTHPGMYIGKTDVSASHIWLNGLHIGISICLGKLADSRPFGSIYIERGWTWSSLMPWDEMREKGMSEEQIIDEMFIIEIISWQRVLAKLHSGDADSGG